MKNCISLLCVVFVVSGCARQELRPVKGPDYTYRAARERLKEQPMALPSKTPYDFDQQLRGVYLRGFEKGWNIAVEYWIGNAIAVPESYQSSAQMMDAWKSGCSDGQRAVYESARKIEGGSSPSEVRR